MQQDFDGSEARLDAEADYFVMDLDWTFDIGEQAVLVVNGGPAWISTDEDDPETVRQQQFVGASQGGDLFRANVRSCDFDDRIGAGISSRCDFNTPGAEPIPAEDLGDVLSFPLELGPQVGADDDMTLFGGASLEATFSDWTVDAEIRRIQSAPSGDALAASLNTARWEISYAPSRANWDAYVAGSWERREALTNASTIDYFVVPGPQEAAQRDRAFTRVRDSDDRRDSFTALIGIRTQFSRALSGAIEVRHRHTERQVSGRNSEADSYYFVAKLSYAFDAFHL